MNLKIRLLILTIILFLNTNIAAKQSVSDILEDMGHSVSRLSDKQSFELTVSRLIQNIQNGNYKALRLLIDENYHETNNSWTSSESSSVSNLFLVNVDGKMSVDAYIIPKITVTDDIYMLDLKIIGEVIDFNNDTLAITYDNKLEFIKKNKKFWLMRSDNLLSNLNSINDKFLVNKEANKNKISSIVLSNNSAFEINTNMLIPKNHNFNGDQFQRFSHTVSNAKLGYSLFQSLGHLGCNIHINRETNEAKEFLVTSDPGFSRYVMVDQTQENVTASATQFPFQGGIAPFLAAEFYLCDRENGKILSTNVESDTWTYFDKITNLSDPNDIDISFYSDTGWRHLSFIVANTGANTVAVFPYSDPPHYAVTGAGGVLLDNPICAKYGRDPATGKRLTDEYFILDAGNDRLINIFTVNSVIYARQFDDFPPGVNLKALTVDTKGYVYVLDSYNALIYKFTPYLGLLGVWGGQGTGDYQLDNPRGIVFAQGAEYEKIGDIGYLRPINASADLLISEYWGANTGIRRFIKGIDITNYDVIYDYTSSSIFLDDKIFIYLSLLDEAFVTFEFIKEGVINHTTPQTTYAAGNYLIIVEDLDSLTSGEYTIRATAVSLYGADANTVIKTQQVYIDRETVDADGDNIGDDVDNCLALANPDQIDTDSDGFGDICDNCPSVSNPLQEDTNNDGIGDVCCCIGIRGNIDSDPLDIIDIGDLIYLVDYMFGKPTDPAPTCSEETDVDASSGTPSLDIADLVYLIDYMFRDGSAPVSCF